MSENRLRRVRLLVSGRVQGVFFRASARERAVGLGLSGWVRNRHDGRVELVAEGAAPQVAELIEWCRSGPSRARVDECQVVDEALEEPFSGFSLLRDC